MAFNNIDIDVWKVLFDLCLEHVDRDVADLIIREMEETVNRFDANIPDLNEPYDDGHSHNTIETPNNDDHNSNADSLIETSENDNVESSTLSQVVLSVESSGSELPQDNLHVSVESSEYGFEHFGIDRQQELLNGIYQILWQVGEEAEDINQEVAVEDEETRRRASYYLHELFSLLNNSAKEESENDDGDDSAKTESESDNENDDDDDDSSQHNLHESNEQNDQKQKYWLNICQQLEGACMDLEDIIQELQINKEPSILGMDIELLKEEILDPVDGQRLENLSKLVGDIEKEAALKDWKNRRRAHFYFQEFLSSFINSAKEESITEEGDQVNNSSDNYEESDEDNDSSDDSEEQSDEENDSSYDYEEESDEENDSVTDEIYYSCDSDPWDATSDISDDESCSVDMNSESYRVLAKSPDSCDDNRLPSEKSTVESDGNEASEPEGIYEMNSAWRNPIIILSSSSDSDADLNPSKESDMEDIHLTDDEFEQTWEFINPKEVHSITGQQQQERSIKERFLSYFGRREMVADEQAA